MNILNSKSLLGLTVAIASILAAVSPSKSYAEDWKIFPGSICQPKRTTAARIIYGGASVINIEREQSGRDRTAHVFCPLVRDRPLIRWKSIEVRVNDNSSSDSVRCTATNYQQNGLESRSVTKTSGASFRGFTSLYFPRPSYSPDGLGGPFQVFCTLPANTSVGNCGPVSALRCGFSAIHNIKLVEE